MKIRNRLIILLFVIPVFTLSQTPGFDFLSLNTNAKTAGFGEIGVVSSSNYNTANSIQNPALVAHNSKNAGISYTYNSLNTNKEQYNYCWDLYYSIDSANTIGFISNHFDYGKIRNYSHYFPDIEWGTYNANEHYNGLYYSHSFNKKFSLGFKFKYVESNLKYKVDNVSFDLGASYVNQYVLNAGTTVRINIGTSLLNLGPKIKYPGYYEPYIYYFQPAEINLGFLSGLIFNTDSNSRFIINVGYQVKKYLESNDPDDELFESYVNAFNYSGFGSINKHKSTHQIGIEGSYIIEQKFLFAISGGFNNLFDNYNSPRYQTFGVRAGVFGFFLDYANIRYGSDNDKNRWLLNIGLNLNMSSKFRFVD